MKQGKIPGDLLVPRQVFHVLAETPCPYLPDRFERKLLTEINGPDAAAAYNLLSRAGFRRSHHFAYRPACSGCTACVPIRVAAMRFRPRRSLKRIAKINADLIARESPALATREQHELFVRYLVARHEEGDMAGMSFAEYRAMVEDTRLDTRMVEFRTADKRLVAACLFDWLEDGPSAVYSFFDPDLPNRSLGTYMVLWLIEAAGARERPYVYLGYWISESPKMAYKARFQPLEALGPAGWQALKR